MAPVTADQTTVRDANLGVVLRHVRDGGAISRARIAAETGLNKSTVSSLVGELIELEVLTDTGLDERPGSVGRPAATVALSGRHAAVGIEINVDYITVAVEDLAGETVSERQIWRDLRGAPPGPVLDELAVIVGGELAGACASGRLPYGLGIALPGLVDTASGVLLRAPNLRWDGAAIGRELASRLEPLRAIRVENESNLAALAELWHGEQPRPRNFILVFGEIGVGGGVVIDGSLFRGAHGFAGEFGHVTVAPHGDRCGCGANGCLETLAGLEVIARRAGLALSVGERNPSLSAELRTRAAAGEARTIDSLDVAGVAIGMALGTASNLLDLDAVVLGGAFAELAPWLVGPIERELRTRFMAARWSPFRVVASSITDGPVRGAAAIVLRDIFDNPRVALDSVGSAR